MQPLQALNRPTPSFSFTVAVAAMYGEVTDSEKHWPKNKTWLTERKHTSEMAKHNLSSLLSGGSKIYVNYTLKRKRIEKLKYMGD